MMNEKELEAFEERNWATVDPKLKKKCIKELKKKIPTDQFEKIRIAINTNSLPVGYHMFGGMSVRNLLRKVIPDEKLPFVEYPDGSKHQNWDDFYMAALREAVNET